MIVRGCALLLLLLTFSIPGETAERPNVLLIMADDLGFSDLGCYGSEIQTPHLDQLANNGIRFTEFYNTARCWPTRAALLTGYYAQQVRRDTIPGVQSGGRGKRPEWAKLLPALLKPAGYRTHHSGKWHLDSMPLQTGFDKSYYLQDQGRFFHPKVHYKDDQALPPVKPGTDYYATTAIADHVVECLKDHEKNHAGKPFFHYLAFTAPHFPLHALPEDIARYRELYRAGWDAVRAKRWEKIQELKLVESSLSKPEPNIGPPYHFPDALKKLGAGEVNRPLPWKKLTAEQQEFQSMKMAIHAAMIDLMDQEIGKVIGQLKAMNAFENTIIFFLSDNGASAEIMVRTDGHDPQAAPGSAASYLCLGPGWSTCSNTPFRRHKTWVHEGGIATPMVVHWPAGLSEKGTLRNTPAHVIDIVPTILELANLKPPQTFGKINVPQKPGTSLLPTLQKNERIKRDSLWWLHEGNRAVRVGDWKLVAAKGDPWSLYDLSKDRTETNDLANTHPEKVRELEQIWRAQFEQCRKLAGRETVP